MMINYSTVLLSFANILNSSKFPNIQLWSSIRYNWFYLGLYIL
jgi:hypothetical protein